MVLYYRSRTTSQNTEYEDVDEILESWKSLPSYLLNILKKAFLYLVYVAMFIGAFLIIWGVIEWMTGWNEHGGKKNIVKGIILLLVSTAPSLP